MTARGRQWFSVFVAVLSVGTGVSLYIGVTNLLRQARTEARQQAQGATQHRQGRELRQLERTIRRQTVVIRRLVSAGGTAPGGFRVPFPPVPPSRPHAPVPGVSEPSPRGHQAPRSQPTVGAPPGPPAGQPQQPPPAGGLPIPGLPPLPSLPKPPVPAPLVPRLPIAPPLRLR